MTKRTEHPAQRLVVGLRKTSTGGYGSYRLEGELPDGRRVIVATNQHKREEGDADCWLVFEEAGR